MTYPSRAVRELLLAAEKADRSPDVTLLVERMAEALAALLSERDGPTYPVEHHDVCGVLIRDGDTLYNPHDRDRYHRVVSDADGRLYLGDLYSPLETYSPHLFWEITEREPHQQEVTP